MPDIGTIRPQLRGAFYRAHFPPVHIEFRAFMGGVIKEMEVRT